MWHSKNPRKDAKSQTILDVIKFWVTNEPTLEINPILGEQIKDLTVWITHKDPFFQSGRDTSVLKSAGEVFPGMIALVWKSACLIIRMPDTATCFFLNEFIHLDATFDKMFNDENGIKPLDRDPACVTVRKHPTERGSFYVSTLWWQQMKNYHGTRESKKIKPPDEYIKLRGLIATEPSWVAR